MSTGIKIVAKHLFGGLKTQRASLNAGEEKKKVVKLVSHFSLHYNLIKFSIETEKGQEFSTDFRAQPVSAVKMKIFRLITKLSNDKFAYWAKKRCKRSELKASSPSSTQPKERHCSSI